MVPMPFLFYMYGKKIRAKSTFSPAPDIAQDKRRDEEARLGADGEIGSITQGSDVEHMQKKKEEEEKGEMPNGDLNTNEQRKERGNKRHDKTVGKTRKEA